MRWVRLFSSLFVGAFIGWPIHREWIYSLHPCNSPYGPAELLLFIPDKQAGQPQVALRVVNKDVHHQNAFCHSYLRHIRHRGRAYENGYLNDFGHPALRPSGASLRLFKIAPGDFVSAEPNCWISDSTRLCRLFVVRTYMSHWLEKWRFIIPLLNWWNMLICVVFFYINEWVDFIKNHKKLINMHFNCWHIKCRTLVL